MWNMSHITALWLAMKPAGVGAPEIRIVFWEWWHAYSIGFLRVISQLIKPIAYSIGVMLSRTAKLSYLYIQYGGDCELFHDKGIHKNIL